MLLLFLVAVFVVVTVVLAVLVVIVIDVVVFVVVVVVDIYHFLRYSCRCYSGRRTVKTRKPSLENEPMTDL